MDNANSKALEQADCGPSRRDFLRSAVLLASGVGLQGLPRFTGIAAAADVRALAAAQFTMELDGQFTGFLKSVEGGFAKTDVVQEKIGPTNFAKKHLANIKYSDIVIQCDAALPTALSKWIGATLIMNNQRKNGSIVTADFSGKEVSRLDFHNALISEITVPACDAASKEPGYLTVKIAPEHTQPLGGKGGLVKTDLSAAAKQKMWLLSNFRLQIQGLEEACTRVTKIEAITIKQTIVEQAVGQLRDYQKEPGPRDFPNLVISLAEANAGPFYQWFDDFVVKGNNSDDKERPGFLDLLAPDLKTILLRINFSHLGICGFAPEKAQAAADKIRQVKVEMYCEQMTLDAKA